MPSVSPEPPPAAPAPAPARTPDSAGQPDRRAALKERHRRAIVDAATALTLERGAPRFTVDELAARADVARRTVFNHFASVDEIVLTAATEVLHAAVDAAAATSAGAPEGDGSRAAMFEELALALRAADLSGVVAYLCRALGAMVDDGGAVDPRAQQFVLEAFSRTGDRLTGQLVARYPDADRFDVEILVTSLLHGLAVVAQHWIADSGTDLTGPGARAAWDRLIDRLIDTVRAGYTPEH